MSKVRFEEVELSSLQAAPYNPRVIKGEAFDGLRASISRFGVVQPIVVNERTGLIVGGHQRAKAIREEQGEGARVMVAYVDLSEEEEKALNIALNSNEISGDFTPLALDIIDELESFDAFDDLLFDELAATIAEDLGLEDGETAELESYGVDDEEPEAQDQEEGGPEEEPIEPGYEDVRAPEIEGSEMGDVWICGDHRVVCGDATSLEVIMSALDSRRPNLIISDPPYGIGLDKNPVSRALRGASGKAKAKSYAPVLGDGTTETAVAAFEACAGLHADAQVWWGANHYAEITPGASCWVVWDKVNGDLPFADAELAWTSFPGPVRIFKHQWRGMLRGGEPGERVHPNQKPVKLSTWLVEKLDETKPVVLDLFAGSGATLIGASRAGALVCSVEISPTYVDHILCRWQAETGLEAVLEGDGRTFSEIARFRRD